MAERDVLDRLASYIGDEEEQGPALPEDVRRRERERLGLDAPSPEHDRIVAELERAMPYMTAARAGELRPEDIRPEDVAWLRARAARNRGRKKGESRASGPDVVGRLAASVGSGDVEQGSPDPTLVASLGGRIGSDVPRESWGRKSLMADTDFLGTAAREFTGGRARDEDEARRERARIKAAEAQSVINAAARRGERVDTEREAARSELMQGIEARREARGEPRTLEEAAQQRREQEIAAAREGLSRGGESGLSPALAAAIEASKRRGVEVNRPTFGGEQEYLGDVMGQRRAPIYNRRGQVVGYGGYQDVTEVNPLTGERERVPGTMERSAAAQREIMDQEEAEAAIYADRMRRDEIELAAKDAAVVRNNQRRVERMADEADAVKRQAAGITAAADAMAKSPDLGSWWQSRTAGQKVGAILQAVLLRMVGVNPMEGINLAVQEEQQRAKFNFQKRGDALVGRQREQAGLMNVYDVVGQHAQTEREADLMAQLAVYENVKRRLATLAADRNTRMLPGQREALEAQLDEEMAGRRMQLQQMAAASVPTRTVVRSVYPGLVRKALIREGEKGSDFGRDVQMEGVKSGYKQREEAYEKEQKLLRGEGGIYREAQSYAKEVGVAEGLIRQIDEILGQEDIAGYGTVGAQETVGSDPRTIGGKLNLIAEQFGRMQSGGAIPPEERASFEDFVREGTNLGGEDRLRQNLQNMRDMATFKIQTMRKAMSPEGEAYIKRGEPGKFKAEPFVDPRLPSVVDVDE